MGPETMCNSFGEYTSRCGVEAEPVFSAGFYAGFGRCQFHDGDVCL